MDTKDEKVYPKGNTELLSMISSKAFNTAKATSLLEDIPDINLPILDLNGYPTTYLFEAQSHNNLKAVRFLLENGADPNFCDPESVLDSPFWDLQFPADEKDDDPTRLEIARLFLEHGADAHLVSEGETLFEEVRFEISEYGDSCPSYVRDFYELLIAYGRDIKQ